MSSEMHRDTTEPGRGLLPAWTSVLAVVAHPDDESFGLGAVLSAFVDEGAQGSLLCLTHGEASTLHGVAGDLQRIRTAELIAAARVLGLHAVELADYPDGRLNETRLAQLTEEITDLARRQAVEGLVVFDTTGITGHADHRWATRAAVAAGGLLEIPVLAWTLPDQVASTLNTELGTSFRGRPTAQIDLVVDVDRSRQLKAGESHRSQAVPGAPLWRRLELLQGQEHLRWLHPGNPSFPVELQFTADCPNWQDAYAHLVQALTDLGRDDDDILLTVVHDHAQAQELHFTGSPTVLVGGVDPFIQPSRQAALACRLYDTPEGRSGTPTQAQVTTALRYSTA
jgi:LmbE family N-acetylglucosaminyl deacetylase